MSISEKLVAIAENEQKVYDAGYKKGKIDGNYDQGVADGKKAEYDEFWDAFQVKKGAAQSYQYLFCGTAWNDITFKPKYDIVFNLGYTGTNAFWGNGVTDIAETLEQLGLKMDTTLCGYWTGMFQNAETKRLPELNCSHAMDYGDGGLQYTFANSKVETIDKMIVVEELKYTNTFKGCANLKNIIFEGVVGNNISFADSPLSKSSVINILEHLKDFRGTSETKTLTLSTSVKLLQSQVDNANAIGWTIAGGTVVSEEEYYA